MAKPEILITGANGEIGHSLIEYLAQEGRYDIVTIDLQDMADTMSAKCKKCYRTDILNNRFVEEIEANHTFEKIFHLAAILSTGGEHNPSLAHKVNVDGSFNMLNMAMTHSKRMQRPCIFIFPSSIAVYGIPDLATKSQAGPIKETDYLNPITIYGISKRYVETLGEYYSTTYQFLSERKDAVLIDFRAVRFPGLISADIVPTGGTSDYGPEMLHAAAKGEAYQAFVGPEATLPFMAMPDAVKTLIDLSRADAAKLTRRTYNVTAFSRSAAQIREEILCHFPQAQLSFAGGGKRELIVHSWPADIDDSAARADWGWQPNLGLTQAFKDYLVPKIAARYRNPS